MTFCRQMFLDLTERERHSKHPTARDVSRLFKDTVFRLRYTTTIRQLASRLQELNLREIMSRGLGEGERYDIFGRAYEYLLQQFGQNKEFAEYFTPRHIVDRMIQIISMPDRRSVLPSPLPTCLLSLTQKPTPESSPRPGADRADPPES